VIDGDACISIKDECELIKDSELCETYGAMISEIDWNTLECFWISNNNNNISTGDIMNLNEGRCISKVYDY
jgi:hypothetical protein